jgi:hypothetical protein
LGHKENSGEGEEMTTELGYKLTKLEQVIKGALDQNINKTCPHCQRGVDYEDYSDPVGAISKAVSDYILGQYAAWVDERIKIMRASPSNMLGNSEIIEEKINALNWTRENLKRIVRE